MAEDAYNPLNDTNETADAPAEPEPAIPESVNDVDDGLADFLEETELFDALAVVDDEPDSQEPEPPVSVQTPAVEPEDPAQPAAQETTLTPPATPEPASAPNEELQRETLELLRDRLQAQTAGEEPVQPQLTPQQAFQSFQPQVQQAVEAGWITEEHAALYPQESALIVYALTQLQQGGQRVQQIEQYTEAERHRQAVGQAQAQLNTAIDEVAARGGDFGLLSDPAIRKEFEDFIYELDPQMSKINADFLAKQYFAFNHEPIMNAIREQNSQPNVNTEPTPTQLAQQEGVSTRPTEGATPEKPEFADLLAGLQAERWF